MTALSLIGGVVGSAIIVLGLAIILGGALGLLRFPDFYTRLHGARAADGLGAAIFLTGLAVLSGDAEIALRLILLAALVAALAPVMSHMAANAAHTGGLAPLVGRYTAPRPGERKDGA